MLFFHGHALMTLFTWMSLPVIFETDLLLDGCCWSWLIRSKRTRASIALDDGTLATGSLREARNWNASVDAPTCLLPLPSSADSAIRRARWMASSVA